MGTRGPLPKDPDKRRRRNATPPQTELPARGNLLKAPALPGSKKYTSQTRRWYRTWCRSPQATKFTLTDWMRLHMLAVLVDQFYREPDTKLMAEIRQNETKLGATPDDRIRMRWTLAEPDEESEGKATPSRSRPDPRRSLKLVD